MEALILIISIPVVMAGAPILFVIWSRRHMWMNGTDGYPPNQNKHKAQCQCDRCLDRLHRNIHRLEVELGMAEPEPPRNIVDARMSTGEQVLTLRADRVTAEYYYPGKPKTLRPVPWFYTGP